MQLGDQPFLTSPIQLNNFFFPLMYSAGARSFVNSWGAYPIVSDRGGYVDSFLYANQDAVICFAAGNDGVAEGEYSISSPGTSKSAITVGSHDNSASSIDVSSFQSRGFVTDGRIKPEVIAPGGTVYSARSDGNSTPEFLDHCDDPISKDGTSMATPMVGGMALLLREYFEEGFYPTGRRNQVSDGFEPMGALVKGLLVNSGQYMAGVQANAFSRWQSQGWGRIEMDETIYFDESKEGYGWSRSSQELWTWGDFGSSGCTACPTLSNVL